MIYPPSITLIKCLIMNYIFRIASTPSAIIIVCNHFD